MKQYKQIPGQCSQCTLFFNCKGKNEDIKHFLRANCIECKDGLTVKIEDDGIERVETIESKPKSKSKR